MPIASSTDGRFEYINSITSSLDPSSGISTVLNSAMIRDDQVMVEVVVMGVR
jgi:hypothetical protein